MGIPFTLTSVNYKVIGESVVIGILACVVGAIMPSLMVVKLKPVDILRPYISTSMIKSRVTSFEKLLGRFCFLPIRIRMSIRNLFRNRVRTTTTIIGIAFSLMLTLSMVSLMDSFYVNVNIQFDHHVKWNLRAQFSTMKNVSELVEIKNWDGVNRVEPFITGFVTLKFSNKSVDSLLIALPANTSMHLFNIVHGMGLKDGMLIVGEGLANKLHVEVNDTINMVICNSLFKINISGIDKEPLFLYACFTTLKTAQKLFNAVNQANGILLNADPTKISDIRKKLYEIPGIERVDVKSEIKSEWIKLLDEFTVFSYIMLIVSMLVAFSLVLNTITINVIERKYETTTLRVLGVKTKTLIKLIVLENLVLATFGLLIGTGLGYLSAYLLICVFIQTVSEELMILTLAIKPLSYLSTIFVLLTTIFISQIPAIKYVSKINLAQTIKEAAL